MSRKFFLALSVVASSTALCVLGHIADGVYSAVIIATTTAYFGANVLQKKVANATI